MIEDKTKDPTVPDDVRQEIMRCCIELNKEDSWLTITEFEVKSVK